ncbi:MULTISPECIES: DUF2273 domain-containing protein [Arthrobacter]|uniref:DUF2273 domain-containing protein n=1 Tax=unclassified Arthrobacter TaxID=235627 RepID=UPI0024B988FC|nr:DUF2273 domain-containing protein [Arthrobacter sp. H35-MC1]MDJ0317956.1 DUF2273 domain-containing protein [Arthrobacter sp. H35-MC1]
MSATVAGTAIAATLAITALVFGFWAMLLVALFMAVGALIGRSVDGRLDLRSVFDALRGKRTSS